MKKIIYIFISACLLFIGCETDERTTNDFENGGNNTGQLQVKIENSAESEFTIVGIHILNMGAAGELPEPNGEFSENIMETNESIARGSYKLLSMGPASGDFAYCQLTVDNGDGTAVRLSEQEGYTNTYEGTITHWGSNERTVTATVIFNQNTNRIMVSEWSEWAGIE